MSELWRNRSDTGDSVSDEALIDQMIRIGMVRAEDVQGSSAEKLVADGLVTEGQVRRLTQGMGRAIATCYSCLKRSIYDAERFSGTFLCQHCHEAVSFEDHTAGLGEALLPDPPSRVVDKLAEKLLIKSDRVSLDQIEALKEERKRRIPRPTLIKMLREQDLVDARKLRRIKRKAEGLFRERVTDWQDLVQDFELACFLCCLRVVSQAGLSAALLKQLEAVMNGTYMSFRDHLAEKGLLTQYQLDYFLPLKFDKMTQRIVLLSHVSYGPVPDDDDDVESEWEDSIQELVEEMHSESSEFNTVIVEDGE